MITSINKENFSYLKNSSRTLKILTESDVSSETIRILDENSEYIQDLLSTKKKDIVDIHLSSAITTGEINSFSIHRLLFNDENFTRMLFNPNSNPFQRYED